MNGVCRDCGCVALDACVVRVPGRAGELTCWWVEDDLCSACDGQAERIAGPNRDHRGETPTPCDRCDNPAEINLGLYLDEPVLLCGECYEAAGDDDQPDNAYGLDDDGVPLAGFRDQAHEDEWYRLTTGNDPNLSGSVDDE